MLKKKTIGVASSVVEHSAFNRSVLSSSLRRPIYPSCEIRSAIVTLPISLPVRYSYASKTPRQTYCSRKILSDTKASSSPLKSLSDF